MVLGVLAFPLAKIAEAHRVSEDSRLRGKLVLVVGSPACGSRRCRRTGRGARQVMARSLPWRSPAPERPQVTVSNPRARTTGAKCARPTHWPPGSAGLLAAFYYPPPAVHSGLYPSLTVGLTRDRYLARALAARGGLWGNHGYEAAYPATYRT